MYLTIYKLNTNKPSVCRAILDAAEMHRQVQYMFDSARKDHQVLYRLDQGYLLVQSDIAPIRKGIFDIACQYNMDDKLDMIQNGTHVRFRIKTVPRASSKGKKHYIKTTERRLEWLKSQFEKHGITLLSVREKDKSNITVSSKKNVATGGDMNFTSWEYEGVGAIQDRALFLDAYETGIGSQKAYGCGMICLCG